MATITVQKRPIPVLPTENKREKNKSKKILLNASTLMMTMFLFIVLTCFFYLSEFNKISSQGVVINDLERQRSELIIENEVWNMRIAQLKSMDVIEHQDVVRRMPTVDPAEIEFINLDVREGEGA
ncbi:MAG: hypothetical protein AB7J40_02445 [Candidatus Altimarinota bacterium]